MKTIVDALEKILAGHTDHPLEISRSEVLTQLSDGQGKRNREAIAERFERYEADLGALQHVGPWRVHYSRYSSTFVCERLPSVPQIERFAEINQTLIEGEIERRLIALDGWQFELAITEILRGCDWIEEVQTTRRSKDGGIDIEFMMRDGPFASLPGLAQVKRWESNVPVADIRQFIGVMETTKPRPARGLFIALRGYTAEAREFAEKSPIPLRLCTLEHVLEWQRTSQTGIKLVPLELTVLDEVFWNEIANVPPAS